MSAWMVGRRVLAVDTRRDIREQWDSAVRQTVEEFGSLTTLVNNAGVLHRASLAEETPAGFEGSWRVNCLGPFLGIQAALEHLRQADGAAIVNTCSTGAIRPFPTHAAYGSSKWALRGLTQIAAAELAASGIRVNAVLPGPVETPMLDAATQARLAEEGPAGQADGDRRRSGVPGIRACVVHHRCRTRRRRRPVSTDRVNQMAKSVSVGIIGAGPGGLALGIFLRRPVFATSRSSTARTASAAPGASTPTRAWPAT